MNLPGIKYPVVVSLAAGAIKYNESIPALRQHNPEKIVGHLNKIDVKENKEIAVFGRPSGSGKDAAEVQASSKQGFPWQMSIGADVLSKKFVPEGKSITVNNRKFDGPVIVATKVHLKEVSFVALGADKDTSAIAGQDQGAEMNFKTWLAEQGVVLEHLSASGVKHWKAKFESELQASGSTPEDDDDDDVTDVEAEDDSDIEAEEDSDIEAADDPDEDEDQPKITASRKKKVAKGTLEHANRMDELYAQRFRRSTRIQELGEEFEIAASDVEKAIRSGKSVSYWNLKWLRASRETVQSKDVRIQMGFTKDQITNSVIECSLSRQVNLDVEKAFDEQTLEASDRAYPGGIGLQQYLIQAASISGYKPRMGERVTSGNLGTLLKHVAASWTTFSLPNLLQSTAKRSIVQGFTEQDQTWKQFGEIESVPDFRRTKRVRLLDNFKFERLAADGTIKHGKLGEQTMDFGVETFAKMGGLDRVSIINDDLGALRDLKSKLGVGAAQALNDLFWTTFMNNSTLFTAAKGNLLTTTPFDVNGNGLIAARNAFARIKSPDGKRIYMKAQRLVVPVPLQTNAEKLFVNTNTNTGTESNANANIMAGKFSPIVPMWLDDPDIPGSSPSTWYLFGDTSRQPVIVSFLNGVQTPTVEEAQVNFNMLGIEFRGYFDVGCDLGDEFCGMKITA